MVEIEEDAPAEETKEAEPQEETKEAEPQVETKEAEPQEETNETELQVETTEAKPVQESVKVEMEAEESDVKEAVDGDDNEKVEAMEVKDEVSCLIVKALNCKTVTLPYTVDSSITNNNYRSQQF